MSQLKLVALDMQDLEIVSAHVQDAVMKVEDLSFMARERRFVAAINRFAWENGAGLFSRHNERRRSVLHFDGVKAVRSAGIARDKGDEVLSLLAVRFEPGKDAPEGVIELVFSGNATIRLDVDFVEARLADLGGAWEASSRPRHKG